MSKSIIEEGALIVHKIHGRKCYFRVGRAKEVSNGVYVCPNCDSEITTWINQNKDFDLDF